MYQPREPVFGPGGAIAALPFDHSLVSVAPKGARVDQALTGFRQRLADIEPVVDLGARIGSREWFRGLFTCGALCFTAWSFAPSVAPLQGYSAPKLAESEWQESRATSFAPLAYGADTGVRMASTDAVEILPEAPERPQIELSAMVGQGDGFVRALERSGVAGEEAEKVSALVADAVSIGSIPAGTKMDVVLGRRANKLVARPLEKISFRARLDLALSVERSSVGTLELRRIPIAVDDTPLRIQGVVGESLYRSARAAGAPAKAVETYIRTIATHVPIGSIGSDNRYDLVVAQRRAETGEVEIGDLMFAGLQSGKRKTQLVKWTKEGRTEWFEASGVGERRGMMQMPVSGHVTSSFGLRMHPLLGYTRFHRGVDFGAAYGSPIVAATDGTVVFAGWHGGHGNFVKLQHGGGLGTGYGHMSRIAVHNGERVRQGEVIGYVGSTGLSTGPHLHYEVYRNGEAINPSSVSFVTTAQLAGAELGRFKATLAHYLNLHIGQLQPMKTPTRSAALPAMPKG